MAPEPYHESGPGADEPLDQDEAPKTSQQLIDESQGLVRALATRIHRTLPPSVAYEDVLAYGQLGLTQAARSYRAGQGASFATFAYYRIRGAIYDGLAKMAWSSRAQRGQIKSEQMANACLEEQASVAPSYDDDIASHARWLVETTERLATVQLATNLAATQHDLANCVDDRAARPEEIAENHEAIDQLRQCLQGLPEPDRRLIQLTYFEDFSLAEAAKVLGRSRSWACRKHARLLSLLAQKLGATTLS